MINVIPAANRYQADFGWLKTNWLFSFGDYHDPKNMNWSALRVFNDDFIRGGGTFDMHPHRDMEIITYVIDGALRHGDSLGNGGTINPGEVQTMSAGKGIFHSEANASATQELRLLQLWIMPRQRGATPRWAQKPFAIAERTNKLLPVVSPDGSIPGTLPIDQDATVYVSRLESNQAVSHELRGRHGYLYVISGTATVNNQPLQAGDQARMLDEASLTLRSGDGPAELIFIDLP